jgi:flagellar export protein FliJ
MAAKFHFPLARLLRVKEIEEKAAQARSSEADLAARAREEAAARRSAEALEARSQLLQLQSEGVVRVDAVLGSIGLVDAARRRADAERQVALTSRFQAEQQRVAWVERRRDLKGLEKLRERRREEFLAVRGAIEAALMDETAALRHARRAGRDQVEPLGGQVDEET